MDYQPLPFPIPPEIAADLCDPGSPPEGHARIVLLRTPSSDAPLVLQTLWSTLDDIDFHVGDGEQPTEYKIGYTLIELLDLLPEWEP